MPFDEPVLTGSPTPFALPLPPQPYWSAASFNSWFDPLYAEASAYRLAYPSQHSPDYLQAHVAQYVTSGTVLVPLPTGWSTLEFTDYMTQLMAEALNAYYDYLFARTPPELIPAVKARINYGVTIDFSFASGTLPVGATLTRASTGWALNNAGVLTSYANDVPRFAFDPDTLAPLGLLNEFAATNLVRNSTAAGAVPGTPGTPPTNWSPTTTVDGVTRTIVGTGVEDGYAYIDFRYFGTSLTGANKLIHFDTATGCPALPGQLMVAFYHVRLMAGTLDGFQLRLTINERDSAGTSLAAYTRTVAVTNAPLRAQRYTNSAVMVSPLTAFATVIEQMILTGPVPIDVTLRFAQPQLAASPSSSSAIPTSTVAVTRAADVLTLALANGTYDITVNRVSGPTTYTGQVVSAGTWLVPTSNSPITSVSVAVVSARVSPTVMDFMTDTMPAGAALTRASAGWAHNNAGVLTSYGPDVPRFQHDVFTNASLGLLNEAGAVNTVRNASATGAVAGTPGTAPTNWSAPSTLDGVTRTIVGTGTEDGIPYIDIQYAGTPIAGNGKIFSFDSSTNPSAPAAAGQTWTASVYVRLMAGVFPVPHNNRVIAAERNAAGGNSGGANGPTINPTNAPLRQQRFSVTGAFTNATTAFALAQLSLNVTAGVPCDFTLRIGAPSMVQNTALGSVILTTGAAAVTRAFDILTVVKPTPPGYYDVAIQRASGTLTQKGVDLTSGSGYSAVVANDPSPLQKITLSLSV